jgi:hypothetical protein
MINYQLIPSNDYIKVKWRKTEIGRIYKEGNKWHYRPRGCGGLIRSEEFATLDQMKNYIEGK